MTRIAQGFSGASWQAVWLALLATLSGCAAFDQSLSDDRRVENVPETVALPGGSFYMGDHSGSGDPDERPVLEQTIQPFSISQHEVTFAQYDEYADATGIARPADGGWGRGGRPVINVSFEDALGYAKWLSENHSGDWRLPTEAEWEFSARAGVYTRYLSGNDDEGVCELGNIADISGAELFQDFTECDDQSLRTAVVGSYPPNAFGLYDVHGNVWEWVQDCYQDRLGEKPRLAECDQRVIRGGSFKTPAPQARLSNRDALKQNTTMDQVGFRLVRE